MKKIYSVRQIQFFFIYRESPFKTNFVFSIIIGITETLKTSSRGHGRNSNQLDLVQRCPIGEHCE